MPYDVNGTDMTESQFNRPIQIQEGRSYGKPGRLVALLSILPSPSSCTLPLYIFDQLAANDSHKAVAEGDSQRELCIVRC